MQIQSCTHKEETTIAVTTSEIITVVEVITVVVRNQGDSAQSSMVANTGQTHATPNTTELQVVSEQNI